ncbi:MAG: glycosyltransferase family 39 protein [Acidobacteria bacterium]|nr:glycosyltransferase family 39 protein [Acidobacteriota bacterium]
MTRFLFLFLVLYLTVGLRLGGLAFVGADEPRYAQVAEEMWQSGDYIVPTLHGKPWLEKPPLYYWLAAAGYSLFGVSEMSARLPSALVGAASILLLWWVLRGLANEDTAFAAALTASTAPLFFVFSRAASTDSLFSALLSAGLLLYLYGFLKDQTWCYLASGLAIGLAALAKGPVALLLAALVAVPVLFLYPSMRRSLQMACLVLASAGVAVPWYWRIIERTGFEFISVFILNHNLARFFTRIHHHEQPFYYYVGVLAVGIYPWTVVTLLGGKQIWRRLCKLRLRRPPFENQHPSLTPELCFLGSWIVLPFLFFSLSQSKLPAYVLPLVMPLAIVTALLLPDPAEEIPARRRRFVFALLGVMALAMGGAATLALETIYHSAWRGVVLGLLLGAGSLLGAGLARRSIASALVALAGANVVVVVFLTMAVLPAMEPFHSTRQVVRQALATLPADGVLYQYRTFHHTVGYYSRGRAALESLENPAELRRALQRDSPLWLIVEQPEVPRLENESDLRVQILGSHGNWSAIKVSMKDRGGGLQGPARLHIN